MACRAQDLTIKRGETFSKVFRWESTPFVSKAITGITAAAPPVITATSHGIPDGWRVAIVGVQGMTEINADVVDLRRLKETDFYQASVLTADTLSLKDLNAAGFTAYASGGYVVHYTPVSLSGYTARMQIRETEESSTTIVSLTTENGGITLDDTTKTITITIAASVTEDIEEETGVYDLEMISGSTVTRLVSGNVVFDGEVTR